MKATGKDFQAVATDDASEVQVRLAVVQAEERPNVEDDAEPRAMSFPHLLIRELIALVGISLFLVLLSFFFDAPLEGIANPEQTPNPSKAPWYFLGLQELLHYYPPIVAGVILPGVVVLALVVVPYFELNLRREALWEGRDLKRVFTIMACTIVVAVFFYYSSAHPVWPIIGPTLVVGPLMALPGILGVRGGITRWLSKRSLPFFIFVWFLLIAVALTTIGTLFRGPGWGFTVPWIDGVY